MEKREIIRDILLILCVFVLFVLPWTYVFGVENESLAETIRVFQRYAGLSILLWLVFKLIYKIHGKSLGLEVKEEEIKEADQDDKKQVLFKPRNRMIIIYLLLLLPGIEGFIYAIFQRKPNEDPFVYILMGSFLIFMCLFMWYITPVFIFAEDSVQIKPFLLYCLGIDRKTVIKYTDITSVGPDANFNSNAYGIDRKNRLGISVGGTTTFWVLGFYTGDTIVKIYLRFKEKLGDKVKLE